ncbi:MAG: hypothetical protein LBN30_03805 [Oscillospiraceae bacterium]|nr:hypothetical protein [Oscillospiraceae bacterium]
MSNAPIPRPYFPEDVTQIPPRESLPDLFEFLDPAHGRVKSPEEWGARADELSELMQYYLYGHKHFTPEDASRLREVLVPEAQALDMFSVMNFPTFSVKLPPGSFTMDMGTFSIAPNLDFAASEDYDAPDGNANLNWSAGDTWETATHAALLRTVPEHTRLVVDVTDCGKTATLKLDAFEVPQFGADTDIAGPYPVVIVIGGIAAQQVTTLKQSGYAYISLNTGSVYSDGGNNPHTGAYNELYPYRAGEYELDSGTLMGWAWGISRVIDALKNDAEGENRYNIAWDKTAIMGCSRNGKAAALAAAFDSRVAIAAPSDPGGGGLTGFRGFTEGQLFNYNTPSGYNTVYSRNESVQRAISNPDESAWFCSKAQELTYANYVHAPFDMHAVAALVAPRPLICWTGEAQQSWLNSPGTVLSMTAAREVYDFLGAGGNIAWVVRDAAHANQDRDLPDLIAIMDKTFGRAKRYVRRSFDTLKNPDGGALDGSGAIFPERVFDSISDLTRSPYDIENHYITWARPGKHTLYGNVTYVLADTQHSLRFTTDADAVTLLNAGDAVSRTAKSTRKNDTCSTFTFYTKGLLEGRYVAETVGTLCHNTREIVALSPADALRHGLNLTGGSPDGMSVGFTNPIVNCDGDVNVPELYVNGARITASRYDDGTKQGYLERYGVSLKPRGAAHIPVGEPFAFEVRNLQLQAFTGYTFSVSVELTKVETTGFMGNKQVGFASQFGETPSWDSENLQNTPFGGNFHGAWPIVPNTVGDDGSRPMTARAGEAYTIGVQVENKDRTGLTLVFDTAVNPREFGIGLHFVSEWELEWAADGKSVRVTYPEDEYLDWVELYIFRLVSAEGCMISAPIHMVVEVSE